MLIAAPNEVQEIYEVLCDPVADGSLSAAVDSGFPLEGFHEALAQPPRVGRSGKDNVRAGWATM